MANDITGKDLQEVLDDAKPDPKKNALTLLRSVKRDGMEKLILWLEATDFFTAPASIRDHNSYPGGLLDHCLGVYNKIAFFCTQFQFISKPDISRGKKPLPVTSENIIIASFLHDVNKISKYASKDGGGYKLSKSSLTSHAKLSIQRVSEFIKLDDIEKLMIQYHMGIHYAIEMDAKKGEYHLLSQNPEASKEDRYGKSMRNAYYHNPIVEFFGMADMLATQAEKAKMR